MERIYVAALAAGVLLALVQNIAMDQHESTSLDLAHIILLLLVHDFIVFLAGRSITVLKVLWEASAVVVDKTRALSSSHESLLNGRALVAASGKAQTAVLCRRIFQRIPPAHCAGWVRIQKRAILVGRHSTPYLRLLAYHHGLQHAGIAERE